RNWKHRCLLKVWVRNLCWAAAALLALAPTVSRAGIIYDLTADWSDASNPNGVWTYREGGNALPSVADWKNDHGVPEGDSGSQPQKTGKAQLQMLKLPSIWVLGLASATMYVTRYAINSWGILYLQEAKSYSAIEAGSLVGLSALVGVAGSVAYGIISDRLFNARRPPVTLIFGLVEVLALLVIFFSPFAHPFLLTISFALYGFTLNGLLAVLGGLFAIDIAPKKAAGAAMGFIGVFSYVGAAIQEMISGHLIEKGTTFIDGVRHYDFSGAIIFWIGASVLSVILAALLWRTQVRD
ncbi:MAG: MFS transporter, partial [bacterium]